jgi:Protein SCAI
LQLINGEEKGETTAMLLSPTFRSSVMPTTGSGLDPTRQQSNGSKFTMFLTAPLQAFCFLIGKDSYDFDTVIISSLSYAHFKLRLMHHYVVC